MINSLKFKDLRFIFLRNLLLLTNGVIFGAVALLIVFGSVRAGIFLGIIAVINISLGLFQDIKAWISLQKLQLLTASRVTVVKNDGTEESILAEKIKKDDTVKLKIGDQIPCDSVIVSSFNFEINEGLITGESDSILRKNGEHILAGSIVTSGSATIKVSTEFDESRIARMTGGIKQYTSNASPIQQAVDKVGKYFGYILVVTLIFVIFRGLMLHQNGADTVLQIGTMASMLVPQGIAFMVTLFFAYGAANLFKRFVLLQEVNATEKLGRIKNLCMDKTGTITENILSIKEVALTKGYSEESALSFTCAYIKATGDSSQTIEAIKKYADGHAGKNAGGNTAEEKYEITEAVPFSSWRQYGAARIKSEKMNDFVNIFVGPPQIFLSSIKNEADKKWLDEMLSIQKNTGQRILCVMKSETETPLEDISKAEISVVCVFVFYNVLREGISDTINFFQKRGVKIRIISGDNPETTRAVTASSGINDSDKMITGQEMKNWIEADFEQNVQNFTVFAGVLPEQKKYIIQALKKNGFTAMIGDGANDALAIKNADLGIAMWDGAPAVRQLASVILTNNSFSALPGGVELADNIIRYIEMFSSMFINQTLLGLFVFIFVSILNQNYPLTPFNITLINYFTTGMPGILILYWVIWPRGIVHPTDTRPFLKRIIPLATTSAILQTISVSIIILLFSNKVNAIELNTLISLTFIVLGYFFFLSLPKVYQGTTDKMQILQIICLGIFEALVLIVLFKINIVMLFFNITNTLSLQNIVTVLLILLPFCILQYFVASYFSKRTR